VNQPSTAAEKVDRSEQAPPPAGGGQGPRPRRGVSIVGDVQAVEHVPLEGLELRAGHHADPTGRQNHGVGVPDAELIRRYNAGEPHVATIGRRGGTNQVRAQRTPETARIAAALDTSLGRYQRPCHSPGRR